MPETARLYLELWVSLASLLRSYTAVHGLNGDRQATVELGEERITVRYAEKWLDLQRCGERVNWLRENGQSGVLELTEAGRLRSKDDPRSPKARDLHPSNQDLSLGTRDLGYLEGEEMDMAAEAWARELMHES
ncbi:MAG: hypothetical protein ABSE96_16050 [Terracidiphilus sp.]